MRATLRPSRGTYRDRLDAGRALAAELGSYQRNAIVLGIPRGGVVTAAEVARILGADLDVIVAKKIGAPGHEELAIGAVTAEGAPFLNVELLEVLGVPESYLEQMIRVKRGEARAREAALRRAVRHPLAGRTVIIVDDGLATGATMRAAVRAVRREQPASVVVAVPVGSTEACNLLRLEADAVVCPHELPDLGAVGLYYQEFEAVHEDEVRRLLHHHAVAVNASG